MIANMFFKVSRMPWYPRSCNDRRYSYFTRNICNRCVDWGVDNLKILFGACSAIVTTVWRPVFKGDEVCYLEVIMVPGTRLLPMHLDRRI